MLKVKPAVPEAVDVIWLSVPHKVKAPVKEFRDVTPPPAGGSSVQVILVPSDEHHLVFVKVPILAAVVVAQDAAVVA